MAYSHKFGKPFEYEGIKYETMDFNFEKLTGDDIIAIEDELEAEGKSFVIPAFSSRYKIKLAARAAGIGSDVLTALPVGDFNAIAGKANAFLNGGDF